MKSQFEDIPDYRGNRSEYWMEEMILDTVMKFIFKEGSRNRMNEDRAEEQFL